MAKPKAKRRARRPSAPHWETMVNYRRSDSGDSVTAVRPLSRADIGSLLERYELTQTHAPEETKNRPRPSMGGKNDNQRRRRKRAHPNGIGEKLDVDA